jgi:hypothetical protein
MKYTVTHNKKETHAGKVIIGLALSAALLTMVKEGRKLESREVRKTLRSLLKGIAL